MFSRVNENIHMESKPPFTECLIGKMVNLINLMNYNMEHTLGLSPRHYF